MSFTKGFAQYTGVDEAISSGLYKVVDNKVRLSVDSTNKYSTSSTGRKSIRAQSYGYFDNGLLVGDFAHVPVAGCGMWPAFWVYQGELSQTYAEIDILENVNLQTANSHSFYTSEQCTINVVSGHLAEEKTNNCHWVLNGPDNQGCSFYADDGTFGQAFNQKYRVVALQVEAERIRIWHFGKNEIPADLTAGKPNPDSWTKAPSMHMTPKSCNFAKAFREFHIVCCTSVTGLRCGERVTNECRSSTPASAAGGRAVTGARITRASARGKRGRATARLGWRIIQRTLWIRTGRLTLLSCTSGRRGCFGPREWIRPRGRIRPRLTVSSLKNMYVDIREENSL